LNQRHCRRAVSCRALRCGDHVISK